MEYIHAVLLLNKLGKEVNEASIKKVLEAAGAHPDEGRIKALLSALEGVNISDVIKEAAIPIAAPVQTAQTAAPAKEEKKEEKKTSEQNVSGLASLFG